MAVLGTVVVKTLAASHLSTPHVFRKLGQGFRIAKLCELTTVTLALAEKNAFDFTNVYTIPITHFTLHILAVRISLCQNFGVQREHKRR